MKIKHIILSWDFVVASIGTLITALFLPNYIMTSFAASFYTVGITVLSIVFSLFFAALAIIMSSTDNDFICYLEEKKHFTNLMSSFKFTLVVLFISLIFSIILYTYSDFSLKKELKVDEQHKVFFCVFEFLFCYSLLATALSVKDTISFTHFRTRFLEQKKEPVK